MRWLILAISLLASSNLAAVASSINKKEASIKITNKNNVINQQQISALQKVKLPLVNNQVIKPDACYKLSDNKFIYLQIHKVNSQIITNLYYIDTTDINNIAVKDCGEIPSLFFGFNLTKVQISSQELILYALTGKFYLYLNLSDLTKPVAKKINGPSINNHISIIHSINYVNEKNFIISTNDGVFITNLSNLDQPKNYFCDCDDIYVSELLKITDNKYLVSAVISSPAGQIPQLYLFDFNDNLQQPNINKINVDLSQINKISLLDMLTNDSFVISCNDSVYFLKLIALNATLKNLNITFRKGYDSIQVVNEQKFLVTSTPFDLKSSSVGLFSVHIDENNIVCKTIQLPPVSNIKMFTSLIYLSNHNFVTRIWHGDNKIVTYSLDLSNESQPQWIDSGLGTDNILWHPLKIANNSILLNDRNNAFLGILT